MGRDDSGWFARRLHGALRGTAAAMTMTGMRTLTTDLDLIEATPPEVVVGRFAAAALERLPAGRRKAVIVAMHWAYGAGGGAFFTLLPARMRNTRWAGPLYGLTLWAVFEAVIDPLLGLKWHRRGSLTERATLAVDHVLYGIVLTGFRDTPAGTEERNPVATYVAEETSS